MIITADSRRGDKPAIARSVIARFPAGVPHIVRSSLLDEGQGLNSYAGAFLSVRDVGGEPALVQAVEAVLESFGDLDPRDVVLIQPMAGNLIGSDVAANYDLRTRQPYWVIELASAATPPS